MKNMALSDRDELVAHLDRCRDLLQIMRDPMLRLTIEDLIAYLESRLADVDGRKEGT